MMLRYRVYYWTIGLGLGVWDKYDMASTWSEAQNIERSHRTMGRRTRIEAI